MGELTTDEQAQQALANAWQILLAEHVYNPGLENLGLAVGAAEHKAMVRGERASNVMASLFGTPAGDYNVEALAAFLAEVENNPQAQKAWLNRSYLLHLFYRQDFLYKTAGIFFPLFLHLF